jgi:L,D-transpeptidase ErfK/SrfK
MRILGVVVLFLAAYSSSWAGSAGAALSLDELRTQVEALRKDASRITEENEGLRKILASQDDGDLYVVVDTESNRLTLRQDGFVLYTGKCGTGSRQFIKAETGTNWFFETPMGSFTVLGKERNPVWIRPDWSYVEENMPVPKEDDPDRLVRGVLGKYALLLGNGYKIHGTKWTNLLGTHFTHGCVSLGDDDLETVYKSVTIGTKVYIF